MTLFDDHGEQESDKVENHVKAKMAKEENNMSKIYELTPTAGQNQESFYGKAKVVIEEDGTETLYSYDTPIIKRLPDGTLVRLYDDYTMTTGKHIKAFCGLDKKAFTKMPVGK